MLCIFGALRLVFGVRRTAPVARSGHPWAFADASVAPGGHAAIQAQAARAFGVSARLVGCVGDDAMAAPLLQPLQRSGIDLTGVRRCSNHSTGLDVVTDEASNAELVLRVQGANAETSSAQVSELALHASRVLLVGMDIDWRESLALAWRARAAGCQVVAFASPVPVEPTHCEPIDVLVVPDDEFFRLCEVHALCSGDPVADARHLARRFDVELIVLLAQGGACLARRDGDCLLMPATPDQRHPPAGSSDVYVGVLCAALAADLPMERAMALAATAVEWAAISPHESARFPTRAEIESALATRAPESERSLQRPPPPSNYSRRHKAAPPRPETR